MLEFLKPFSGEHSVSRVVAVIHVPQVFLKPSTIFDKLTGKSELAKYQKKSITKVRTVSITNQNVGISKEDKESGFTLEEYDESGRLDNIFKLENVSDKQANISLENRLYKDWDIFLPRFINDVNEVSSEIDVYMEAVSLLYVDEFFWEDESEINVNAIFNSNSELINRTFLQSSNGTLISITQDKVSNQDLEEKIEVSFSNRIKRISIVHQCALKFENVELYSKSDSEVLKEKLNSAHERNKAMLKDVLNKEVLDLIKII